MAIAIDQTSSSVNVASTTTPQTITFSTPPAIGSTIVVFQWGWAGASQTQYAVPTDNAGNTYSLLATQAIPATGTSPDLSTLWVCYGITSAPTTITLTTTGSGTKHSSGNIAGIARSYTGVATSGQPDGSSTASGTTSSSSTGAFTANVGDLAVAVTMYEKGESPTITTPSGWNNLSTNYGSSIDQIVSTTGTLNPTWTATVSSPNWAAVGATLLPAVTVGSVSGSGSVNAPSPSANGTGSALVPTYTGSGSAVDPAAKVSGVGTQTPPGYSGSGAAISPAAKAIGTGSAAAPGMSGIGGATTPHAKATGSGVEIPPTYVGSGAARAPQATGSGSGTAIVPIYAGSGQAVSTAATAHGAGSFRSLATLAATGPTDATLNPISADTSVAPVATLVVVDAISATVVIVDALSATDLSVDINLPALTIGAVVTDVSFGVVATEVTIA